VEVRGKGMQNKRKNTQQQDAALSFAVSPHIAPVSRMLTQDRCD
jgi:hypothetical protein